MKSSGPKDPLLYYIAVAGLVMTTLSVATWMGRPGSSIGASAEPESLRSLASIQQSSSSGADSTSMELVRLNLVCPSLPEVIHVGQNQHQVQFQLQQCAGETLELKGGAYPEPLILFSAEREGHLDSEIVQLKEGVNTFTLEWLDPEGSLRTYEVQVHRG